MAFFGLENSWKYGDIVELWALKERHERARFGLHNDTYEGYAEVTKQQMVEMIWVFAQQQSFSPNQGFGYLQF